MMTHVDKPVVNADALSAEQLDTEFADDACAEVRSYQTLIRLKRRGFWCHVIESLRNKLRQMWQSTDKLMGRGNV